MKILVITPIYKIKGRPRLFHDSSAVHYLLKYWPKDAELLVIYTYFSSIKEIKRYFRQEDRKYYRENYSYEVDGIPVEMVETQLSVKQKQLYPFQRKRLKAKIQEILDRRGFQPDKILCHMPCYKSIQIIDEIPAKEKIAILHYSDVKKAEHEPGYVGNLEHSFDKIYCRSEAINRYFRQKNLKKLQDSIISSGVNMTVSTQSRDWSAWNHKEVQILYVGKLIKRKHADLVIRAMQNLKNQYSLHLKIIGTGVEEANLKRLAGKIGVNDMVEFLSPIPHKDVFIQMASADIFIMPSKNETLGLAYLEAMSTGCITVGTENEGIDGVIRNAENGFLVKPTLESVQDTLEHILQMAPSELEVCSANAVSTAQDMTEEKVGLRYYEIINQNI